MMNYIWSYMIICSLIYSIFTDNLDNVTNSIFDSTSQATELTILMFGLITLWNGIMNILSKTNAINFISKLISPIISRIFKGVDKSSKAYQYICLNFTANLLGLGNAATPLGLNAVKEFEKTSNNDNNVLKLILINTAALQLVPSTIIGLRSTLNSQNPSGIILQIWFCSVISLVSAVVIYNILTRKERSK